MKNHQSHGKAATLAALAALASVESNVGVKIAEPPMSKTDYAKRRKKRQMESKSRSRNQRR